MLYYAMRAYLNSLPIIVMFDFGGVVVGEVGAGLVSKSSVHDLGAEGRGIEYS